MFVYVRRTRRQYKDKTYFHYSLVESVRTAKGPRQRTICNLGALSPRPASEWLEFARKIEAALLGQTDLLVANGDVARAKGDSKGGGKGNGNGKSKG